MDRFNKNKLVDCHFHLDLFENPQKMANDIKNSGIEVISVTNAPSVYEFTQRLAYESKSIHVALGLHPQLVDTHHKELELMWRLMKKTRFIGEIGLDYTTRSESSIKLQRKVFEEILKKCASEGNKVLSVHSRRATKDVIAMVGSEFPGSVILHWFSGSLKDLKKAIEWGMYISVNIAMLASQKGKALISSIDPNLLLTETDGPFVNVGQRNAVPGDVISIINYLTEIWNLDIEETKHYIYKNFARATKKISISK